MNDLNTVVLEGRLVKDPVTGTAKNEKPYTFLTLANNRFYRDPADASGDTWKESTAYFDVRSFNGLSDELAELGSGEKVRITGKLARSPRYVGEQKIYEVFVAPTSFEKL